MTNDDAVDFALPALDRIPYLVDCGKPFLEAWAATGPRDWRDALLARAIGVEWGERRLAASEAMAAWARANRVEFLDAYARDVKQRMAVPIARIVKDRVWPRLPSMFRRADPNLRSQIRNVFTYDLTSIALQTLLAGRGMPPTLHGLIREAYEAGRFPCGYRGEHPGGVLVIY